MSLLSSCQMLSRISLIVLTSRRRPLRGIAVQGRNICAKLRGRCRSRAPFCGEMLQRWGIELRRYELAFL